jgi:hypothetical protein
LEDLEMKLNGLLEKANGKMAAIYKKNEDDQSPTSLLKGVVFWCSRLGFKVHENAVELFDTADTEKEHYFLAVENFIGVDDSKTKRKDRYGALSAWIFIAEDRYLIKFAA